MFFFRLVKNQLKYKGQIWNVYIYHTFCPLIYWLKCLNTFYWFTMRHFYIAIHGLKWPQIIASHTVHQWKCVFSHRQFWWTHFFPHSIQAIHKSRDDCYLNDYLNSFIYEVCSCTEQISTLVRRSHLNSIYGLTFCKTVCIVRVMLCAVWVSLFTLVKVELWPNALFKI